MSSRLSLGFTSVKEVLSYALGAGALGYGLLQAPPDRAWLSVGAGLGLLGAPIVGGLFEGKK